MNDHDKTKDQLLTELMETRNRVIELEKIDRERADVEYKLQKEIDFNQTLLQASPTFYVAIGADGRTLMINDAMLQALGYKQEEVVGKDYISMFVPERNRDKLVEVFEKLVKQKEPTRNENVVLAKDGRELLIEWHGRNVFSDDENDDFFFGVGIDITEPARAAQALRDSEYLLRESQKIANLGSYILNIPKGVWDSSPILDDVFGMEQKRNRSFADWVRVVHPEDRDLMQEYFATNVVKNHETFNKEYRIIRDSDQQERWVHGMGELVYAEDGSPEKMIGTIQDITDRKQTEAALSEAYKIINRSPAVAFLWKNEEGWPVEFVSDNVEILFGYSTLDFLERNVSYSDVIHDDDRERVAEEIVNYSNNIEEHTFAHEPYRIITRKGDTKWISEKTYIRRDSSGIITHYEGIVFDITEEMKLEDQLRQAQKMESVGRLAGGVAHDFNNMLSVILGQSELALEDMEPTQPLYEELQEIRVAALRSADLTRQLLAFARKQTVAPRVLDVNETVAGMIKMLGRLIGEDIDLVWAPGNNLGKIKIDAAQIDQILANLCVNSKDAIEGVGKIVIETGNVTFDETYCADHAGFIPGEFVLLAVSDNGSGIEKEVLDHIFEPFFTSKSVNEGTGLGLAMVYGIVKQNSGFINVYSEVGQGTTLKIYFPRDKSGAVSAQKEILPKRAVMGYETILLVEDEPAILKMTAAMLEGYGYRVLATSKPAEAIRLAGDHADEIHLLITDVVMPGMNGRDLVSNLSSLYPDLKSLFMSGYTANVIAHNGVLDEGVQFLQKPFVPYELAAKVREVLDCE